MRDIILKDTRKEQQPQGVTLLSDAVYLFLAFPDLFYFLVFDMITTFSILAASEFFFFSMRQISSFPQLLLSLYLSNQSLQSNGYK